MTDEDALLHTLSLHHGMLTTPAGNTYRLLVMPVGRRLSLASLQRIADYVRQGGTLAGKQPMGPTGNLDEASAGQFERLVQELWSDCGAKQHGYGSGTVICAADGRSALQAMHIAPDFEDPTGRLDYVHRVNGARDIYFVRNKGSQAVDTVANFRIAGRAPELWNALDGSITPQMVYRAQGECTAVPLHLDPFGSIFVVFRRPAGLHAIRVLQGGQEVPSVKVNGDKRSGLTLEGAQPGAYKTILSDGREVTAEIPSPRLQDTSRWPMDDQIPAGSRSACRS